MDNNIELDVNQAQKKHKIIEKQISALLNLQNHVSSIISFDTSKANSNIYRIEDIYSDLKSLNNISNIPYLSEIYKLINQIKIIERNISDNKTKEKLTNIFKPLNNIEEFIIKKAQSVVDLIQKKHKSIDTIQAKEDFHASFRVGIESSKIMNYTQLNDLFESMKSSFTYLSKSLINKTITEKNIDEIIKTINTLQKPLKDQINKKKYLETLNKTDSKINSIPENEHEEYPSLIQNYINDTKVSIKKIISFITNNHIDIKEFESINKNTSETIKKLSNLNINIEQLINDFNYKNTNNKKVNEAKHQEAIKTTAVDNNFQETLNLEMLDKEQNEVLSETVAIEKDSETKSKTQRKTKNKKNTKEVSDNQSQYLSFQYLEKMYKKKNLKTDFDDSLTHISKSDELIEVRKNNLSEFSIPPEECHIFLENLQNKDVNLFSLFQSNNFIEVPQKDIYILLANFGLNKDNPEDQKLIEQIVNKSEFEFFAPPFFEVTSIKDLKQKNFIGRIERFAYLTKDVKDRSSGRFVTEYIPIIYLRVSHSLQPLAFDTFLYMWDISRILVAEFFKKDEVKKEEIQYIKINDYILKKGSFLPDFISNDNVYYPGKELYVERIFQNSSAEKKELFVELNKGVFSYEELKAGLCEKRKDYSFKDIKIRKGTKLIFNKIDDFRCEIKGIYQHSNNSYSFKLSIEDSNEDFIIREKSSDFFNLYILRNQINIDSENFKTGDQVTLKYFGGNTVDVIIKSVLVNLVTSKEQIKLNISVEDLTGQKSSLFSPEDFKVMLEPKVEKTYQYFVKYNDIVGIDNIFFSTDSLSETNKNELFFSCRSGLGTIGFYSNQQKNSLNNDDEVSFREKLETAMIRVRRGVTFSLIDTNNKYLSSVSKKPITESIVNENFSAKEIKKSIRESMEKINKENLLNSKGSIVTFRHENDQKDSLNFIHAGNSLIFVTDNNQVTYQKDLDVNDFGEISNGLSSRNALRLMFKDEQIKVSNNSQVAIISDGFPIRVEDGRAILKGVLSCYEMEKVILKTNTLPINQRHKLINAIVKLNDCFEEMIFKSVPNCPRININRDRAYQLTKFFKDISFSPVGFFAKIISDIETKYENKAYKQIASRISEPTKENIVRFIIDGILKLLHVNTPREEKHKIEHFFSSLGLQELYKGMAQNLNMLLFFQKDKKKDYIKLKKQVLPQINDEQRKMYFKIMETLLVIYSDLDPDVMLLLTEILLENNDFYINSTDNESYLVKKSKIFEQLNTVKVQLYNSQNSIKKEFIFDLEPVLRKYLFSTIFKDDFTTFFYDIERTDYNDTLVYDREYDKEFYNSLKEYAIYGSDIKKGKISGENLLKIKSIKKAVLDQDNMKRELDILLVHPKIQVTEANTSNGNTVEVHNYLKEDSINQVISSEILNKTSFIGGVKLDSIFKQLGIQK